MGGVPNFGGSGDSSAGEKPCRACTDFKSWIRMKTKKITGAGVQEGQGAVAAEPEQCPLDKDDLGRNTWSLLHTMAAYFPDKPSPTQQKEMSVFIKIFSKYYPCDHCAKDFQKSLSESPPETSSRTALSQWLCRMHNEVNRKLGKPEFDCTLVDERWKDGWQDGSCG